jgi:hypothetical protein
MRTERGRFRQRNKVPARKPLLRDIEPLLVNGRQRFIQMELQLEVLKWEQRRYAT